jgi:glycosyltransferase involved in cell wall biosynthesis
MSPRFGSIRLLDWPGFPSGRAETIAHNPEHKAQRSTSVSAVITAYNYARFLPGAIESVLGQSRVPDEIIVVDDGSTDDTAEVVGRYADVGVRYVYRANGGAGAARNTGIRASQGDLIAFLDGDDRWLPDKTALQLDHFERYPSVGIVTAGECQVHESGGTPLVVRRKPVGSASFYPLILVENVIGNPSLTMVRRRCFETVGLFDETMPLGQDWEMWIRVARHYRVGVVDAVLILFTRHPQSLTSNRRVERYASNKRLRRRYLRAVRSPLKRLRLAMGAQSMNLYYLAASLADTPSRGRAVAAALGAMLLDPVYKSRLKAGLLVRTAFGRRAFDLLKRLAPAEHASTFEPPSSRMHTGGAV